MRPYILCQGAARDVFGGLDVATDEAASVVLKIQNGSLNEEAVVPKDDEKDDDDNEEEYNGTVHPAFEPKQSAATRARHRTDMTVALSLGVDLNSMDAQHMNCTPASLLLPDEEIHDEEDNATPKAPPMSFAGLAHCQIVDMKNRTKYGEVETLTLNCRGKTLKFLRKIKVSGGPGVRATARTCTK